MTNPLLFSANSSTLWNHTNSANCREKSPYFEGKKISHVAMFRQWVPIGSQNKVGLLKNLLYYMSSSQIWLTPLVDDRQSTCLSKLEKKNPRHRWEGGRGATKHSAHGICVEIFTCHTASLLLLVLVSWIRFLCVFNCASTHIWKRVAISLCAKFRDGVYFSPTPLCVTLLKTRFSLIRGLWGRFNFCLWRASSGTRMKNEKKRKDGVTSS